MTDEQKELLRQKVIKEEDFEQCYIAEDGQIFTPNKNKDETITMTAEEKYNKMLNPPTPIPTLAERVNSIEETLLMFI